MEELIRQECEEYGITPDLLTASEIAQLTKEIEARQRGEMVCDSVLDNPEIMHRQFERELAQ